MVEANNFHINFNDQDHFNIRLQQTNEFESQFGEVIIVSDKYPMYEGPYNVIPKLEEQVLATKNTSMSDDVTVEEIPVARVSNPSGGKTCTIGGE